MIKVLEVETVLEEAEEVSEEEGESMYLLVIIV